MYRFWQRQRPGLVTKIGLFSAQSPALAVDAEGAAACAVAAPNAPVRATAAVVSRAASNEARRVGDRSSVGEVIANQARTQPSAPGLVLGMVIPAPPWGGEHGGQAAPVPPVPHQRQRNRT